MSGVDRAALIAAAEDSIGNVIPHLKGRDARFAANVALDAILPLVYRAIAGLARYNCELRPDGNEDPDTAAWVAGIHTAAGLVLSFSQDGE